MPKMAAKTANNNKSEKNDVNEQNSADENNKLDGKNASGKKSKPARRKPVYFWTNGEVLKWLWRQCTDHHVNYGSLFIEHDITGRTLVRMNETSLEKLGIINKDDRDALWQEILKLRLRTDILEMRDLELKG